MNTMTIDPICGMLVDPATTRHTSQYEGRTYHFCSPGCKSAFDADPLGYVASQEEADRGHAHPDYHAHGAPAAHVTAATHAGADDGGMHHQLPETSDNRANIFERDPTGLPDAQLTAVIGLHAGETFDLSASSVRKRIGDAMVKMLGYNGSIPGPTLHVEQGSEVAVRLHNELDLETTVHWHGLRHENRFDGVPTGSHGGMQAPVPPGSSFTYHVLFPDAGIFWYHPHIREDYTQEHGLAGTIIVVPSDPSYWPPTNRELSLVIDDILIEDGQIAPFRRTGSDRTAMGRLGNVMLVNGETDLRLDASAGEVVRLYLTNAANTRVFNVRLPGARLKLVGGDNGRLEQEEFVEEVLIAPSERAVVDAYLERPGRLTLEHRTPNTSYRLAAVEVREQPVDRSPAATFATLRTNPEFRAERAAFPRELERAPDKTVALVGVMPGMAHHDGHSAGHAPPIEWEDTMEVMNRMSTPHTMRWKLVDRETGAENHDIAWTFRVGERVKIRIVNELRSDHPMQHPIHIHGERFLVLGRDGVLNPNLGWKDTVLVRTGETVDLLMDASNPGRWMVHCHIAEHLEGGMMLSFDVRA